MNTRLLDGLMIAALVLMLGVRVLDNQFVSDDYTVFGRISELPNYPQMFLHAQFDHVLPVRNALLFGEFARFGANPRPYYLVNILLHLSATLLLWRWVTQITDRRLTALFAALLFGLGGIHWKTVCWITAQGQILAANFMLLSLMLIAQAVQTRSIVALLTAAVSHFLMTMSFTTSPAILLFVFGYPLLVGRGPLPDRLRLGAGYALPFCFSYALFLIVRTQFGFGGESLSRSAGSLAEVFGAVAIACYGVVANFGAAAVGLVFVRDYSIAMTAAVVPLVLGGLGWWTVRARAQAEEVSCSTMAASSCRRLLLLSLLLLGVGFCEFLLPMLGRFDQGAFSLIYNSYYPYLPNLLFAPASAILLSLVASEVRTRFGAQVVWVVGLGIVVVNAGYFLHHERQLGSEARQLRVVVDHYLADLERRLAAGEPFAILNQSLQAPGAGQAFNKVFPRSVCLLYRGPDYCERIEFVTRVEQATNPVLQLKKLSGALVAVGATGAVRE